MIPVTEIYRELILLYLSFADVKQTSYAEAVSKIKSIILEMYSQYERMIDKDAFIIVSNVEDVSGGYEKRLV